MVDFANPTMTLGRRGEAGAEGGRQSGEAGLSTYRILSRCKRNGDASEKTRMRHHHFAMQYSIPREPSSKALKGGYSYECWSCKAGLTSVFVRRERRGMRGIEDVRDLRHSRLDCRYARDRMLLYEAKTDIWSTLAIKDAAIVIIINIIIIITLTCSSQGYL